MICIEVVADAQVPVDGCVTAALVAVVGVVGLMTATAVHISNSAVVLEVVSTALKNASKTVASTAVANVIAVVGLVIGPVAALEPPAGYIHHAPLF